MVGRVLVKCPSLLIIYRSGYPKKTFSNRDGRFKTTISFNLLTEADFLQCQSLKTPINRGEHSKNLPLENRLTKSVARL